MLGLFATVMMGALLPRVRVPARVKHSFWEFGEGSGWIKTMMAHIADFRVPSLCPAYACARDSGSQRCAECSIRHSIFSERVCHTVLRPPPAERRRGTPCEQHGNNRELLHVLNRAMIPGLAVSCMCPKSHGHRIKSVYGVGTSRRAALGRQCRRAEASRDKTSRMRYVQEWEDECHR